MNLGMLQDESGGFRGIDIDIMNVTLENTYMAIKLMEWDGYFGVKGKIPKYMNISALKNFVIGCYKGGLGFRNKKEGGDNSDYYLNTTYMGLELIKLLEMKGEGIDNIKSNIKELIKVRLGGKIKNLNFIGNPNQLRLMREVIKIYKLMGWDIEEDTGLKKIGVSNIKTLDLSLIHI